MHCPSVAVRFASSMKTWYQPYISIYYRKESRLTLVLITARNGEKAEGNDRVSGARGGRGDHFQQLQLKIEKVFLAHLEKGFGRKLCPLKYRFWCISRAKIACFSTLVPGACFWYTTCDHDIAFWSEMSMTKGTRSRNYMGGNAMRTDIFLHSPK